MSETPRVLVDCKADLGEGPIWHPDRAEFIWFDINAALLYRADAQGKVAGTLQFDEPAAAAAIIDARTLAVITATKLVRVDLESGAMAPIVAVEADNPATRSNDSRVDPTGGFWIGTMGRQAEPGAGAYYHYREGKLTTIFDAVTIPNSTCFSPDGGTAYFTDCVTRRIMKVRIDRETGLPSGTPELFAEIEGEGVPDGSIIDSAGCMWNAQYGGSRLVRYAPDGTVDRVVALPVSQPTCPCLGGPDLTTMFITSARQNMSDEALAAEPHAGSCFTFEADVPGLPETPIRL
jgi:sugar lactone lactonase YvrE